MPVNNLIQLRKGSSSTWSSQNPVLASGEPGYDLTNNILKIGDGITNWNNLSGISPNLDTTLAAGSGIIFSYADSTLTISASGGSGGLNNIVEDITPQLGGNLDLNNYSVNGTGNISIVGDLIANTGAYNALTVNSINVSLSGHTHISSEIADFDSSVSGLLPVKDIIAGSDISVSSISGIYTISNTMTSVETSASVVTTVFNKTGASIPKMTAVYINGGQGDLPTIQKALATADISSAGTYGITYETIDNMSSGRVIVLGALTGLNTDQFNPTAPQGDVNGSVVYLSPTVSGALTTTKPYAPYHIVAMGTIVRTHQNEGVIEVRVQNGYELEELHNVAITGATNGQFLQYNGVSELWVPSSSGNFTTLQLNGTTVSVSGHTHTSSDITNFNSSVSGLLPVTNITAGSGISVSASSGNYTINVDIIDCGEVLAPPNAPTALSVTSANASLVLSWAAPSYVGSTPITGYIVEYTPSGGSASTVNTNSTSTSYTLSGLTNGTSYSIRVRAINSIGNGTYSSTVSQTPSAGVGFSSLPAGWTGTGTAANKASKASITGNGATYTAVAGATGTLRITGSYGDYNDGFGPTRIRLNGTTLISGENFYDTPINITTAITSGQSVTFELGLQYAYFQNIQMWIE